MRNILSMMVVAFVFCAATSVPPSPRTVAVQLETYLDTQHHPELPGGFAVSAVQDGAVILKKAYGTANVEYGIPLSTTSVFDFASIAKTVTGWAVAKLITEGRMSPDDDVREYLPDLPDFGHRITVFHLLHHTSGLRDNVALMRLAGRQDTDIHSRAIFHEVIYNQRELNFAPGEEFAYSNTGYFLLAEVVEAVTGQHFADWCRENVFEPLGMRDTRILTSHAEIVENRAIAYRQYGEGSYVNSFAQKDSPGSSSLYSTLDDITTWLLTIGESTFGGPEVWDLMLTKGTLNNGDSVAYGYGLTLGTYGSHAVIRHGGQTGGYLSDLVYFPDAQTGYVLMINRNPPAVSITGSIDDILLGIADTGSEGADTGEQPSEREEADTLVRGTVSESFLRRCAGSYYSLERTRRVEVRNEQGAMKMDFPWQRGLDVIALANGRFYLEEYEVAFTFVTEDDGRVTALEFIGRERNSRYNRLQLNASGWDDLGGLLGEYYSDELQVGYSFVLAQNALVARRFLDPDVVLARYDENYFLGDSWWFSSIHLTRDDGGRITGFLLQADNERVRNLRFRKRHP